MTTGKEMDITGKTEARERFPAGEVMGMSISDAKTLRDKFS